MSMVSPDAKSDRPTMPGITRRGMLATPMALATPRRTEEPASPRGTVKANDAQAEWLEGLLDALRRTWPVEAAARHAHQALVKTEYGSSRQEAAFRAAMDAQNVRDRAYGALSDAVLEVAGARDLTEDRWERFGLPWGIVATDRHLFIVHPTDQAEFYEDNLEDGMTDLVILDL